MGATSQVLSVIHRLGELVCSTVVLAVLGRFFFFIDLANTGANGRLIYACVVASISLLISILFMPPLKYSFFGFPFDFVLFVMWLVAFCLLETLTGVHTCSSDWYLTYWGYYWGRFWVVDGDLDIGDAGCASWRSILAFCFMAMMAFLFSGFLGMYVCAEYHELNKKARELMSGRLHIREKKELADVENSGPVTQAADVSKAPPVTSQPLPTTS